MLFMQHFWVVMIVVNFINVLIMKVRIKKFIEQRPDLKEDYDRYFTYYTIILNLPWAVAGVGAITGDLPTVFHALYIRGGSISAILFNLTIIGIMVFLLVWVHAKDGARFLVEHPGLTRYSWSFVDDEERIIKKARQYKFYFTVLPFSYIVSLVIINVVMFGGILE